jgi:hypothetical protein
MSFDSTILGGLRQRLLRTPYKSITINGFTARLIIPEHDRIVNANYSPDIKARALAKNTPKAFEHFGVEIIFTTPTELNLYDDEYRLDENLKPTIEAFGPVLLRNAYVSESLREKVHHNIFPSLSFHVDRGRHVDNQYSLFMRDPFHSEQKMKRESSTLIITNKVAALQALEETDKPFRFGGSNTIFNKTRISEVADKLMIHQGWQEPDGTGEICIFDNRTVQHASHYLDKGGYRIGVQYLY